MNSKTSIESSHGQLKRYLSPLHLWSIAVGLVISGEYFGWSYGWGIAGTVGFLISTLFVALMYTTFVFSFTELTTSIPDAGGAYTYALRSFGPLVGVIAGYSALIELLFASPAIAFSLGSYLHFIYPSISVETSSIFVLVAFTFVNLLGVHYTARFELIVTLIAVVELLIFIGLTLPHFKMEYFLAEAFPFQISGVFAAIPYAIWFFLAIEGVAVSAEETKNPKRDIPIGYISGIITLVILALLVMFSAGGVGDWKNLSHMDYPVPEALAMALGRQNSLVKLLAGIGIFGLVASLNGIIYSSSRQVFSLGRSGCLPSIFSHINKKFQSPHWAVLLSCGVGIISLLSGKTSELITLSALGAVSMYVISMLSLLILRRREPLLQRPFKVPFYPYFPVIALISSFLSLIAIIYYNRSLAVIYIGIITCGLLLHAVRGLGIQIKKETIKVSKAS